MQSIAGAGAGAGELEPAPAAEAASARRSHATAAARAAGRAAMAALVLGRSARVRSGEGSGGLEVVGVFRSWWAAGSGQVREEERRRGLGCLYGEAPLDRAQIPRFILIFPFSSRHPLPPEIRRSSRWEQKPRVLPHRRPPPPASPRPLRGRSPSALRSSSPGSSARSFFAPLPQLESSLTSYTINFFRFAKFTIRSKFLCRRIKFSISMVSPFTKL